MGNKLSMKKLQTVFYYILVILLFILSIKKGGFYKQDTLFFNLSVVSLGIIHLVIHFINNIKNKRSYNISVFDIALILLPFAYLLPIMFSNYTNLSDSIYEMIRYFNLFVIYQIVKNSNNKKIYINGIIIVTLLQCLLSIDEIGSKYLQNILSIFNSGYSSINITRMAGTIQYANILAILCLISIIFVIDKLKNDKRSILLKSINILELFLLFSTLILTGSRLVWLLGIIAVIWYITKNKDKSLNISLICVYLLTITFIYCVIIYNNIMTNTVYYIFLIFAVITYILGFLLLKLVNNKNLKRVSLKRIMIILLIIFIVYIIIGFRFTNSINIDSQKNNTTVINLYNIYKGKDNSILIDIKSKVEDTRYDISLEIIDKENNCKKIDTLSYYQTISEKFKLDFDMPLDAKSARLNIKCSKGNFDINKLTVNNKNQVLEYTILPTEFINRIKDTMYGSSSISDRFTYYVDALKIITRSVPNFVIGVGGEGFNNLYDQVQTTKYFSSEVHSSYLQIFVESGVFGFVLIFGIVILSIVFSKKDILKLSYSVLVFHLIFDLDFSYMLIIAIFGIMLALLNNKEKSTLKINSTKYLYCIFNIVTMILSLTIFIILLKANIAYYMKIPKIPKERLTLEEHSQVVYKNEERLSLDPTDNNYISSTNEAYSTYLELLLLQRNNNITAEIKENLDDEIKYVIYNLEENLELMYKNDKVSKTNLEIISNLYIEYLEYFVQLNYLNNEDEGYEYYLDKIIRNLEYIYNNYTKSLVSKVDRSFYENFYNKLNSKQEILNSEIIYKKLLIMKEKFNF